MTCKRCQSSDIERSRRKTVLDQLKAALGWWPYRCDDCGLRFHARGRSLSSPIPEASDEVPNYGPSVSFSSEDGPAMAFRADVLRPQAKIVVSAENYDQLNHILLALDRAVSSYQTQSKQEQEVPFAHTVDL